MYPLMSWHILRHPGMSAILYTTTESRAFVSLSRDILGQLSSTFFLHVHVSFFPGYPRMSAILHITVKSQADLSLFSWHILGHPVMSAILHKQLSPRRICPFYPGMSPGQKGHTSLGLNRSVEDVLH